MSAPLDEGGALWVVVRSHDDMPLLRQTLGALGRQRLRHRLLVMDHASRDGSREEALEHGARVIDVPHDGYIPGRVLNQAMEATSGEVTAFVNADCTPQSDDWLELLLAPFESPRVAATFGRQIPRPDCPLLLARDTEHTFGDGSRQRHWRHCFSMAAAAIRREAWLEQRFDERLAYSEDVDWTWRARCANHEVAYTPEAVAMHSHAYSVAQWQRRQHGEGKAEAHIFPWSRWQASWARQVLLPVARQLLEDLRWCAAAGALEQALNAPLLRGAGAWARWRGLQEGLRELREGTEHGVRDVCVEGSSEALGKGGGTSEARP